MITIPKGTKDVLPQESYKWKHVEGVAREIASQFCILEVRTPVFEHTELFLRGVGDTTDIVNKEMYTFLDKGERSLTLKPEGTAGVARCFIENGLNNLTMPLKTFYFTPVFRYERPQAGRLREHHQFGVEIFGSPSPAVDAELILIAATFFKKLGISDLVVSLNSIGCPKCRPQYNAALREFYGKHIEQLCPVCRERLEKNPLRILDCKEEGCKAINEFAPSTLDYLCDECLDHFNQLQRILTGYGISYQVNPRIVRGLDYYTKTVFEFVSNHLGAKSTVCGGGRYDGLVESLGGKPTPAAGFGLGLERLILTMENMNLPFKKDPDLDLYIAPVGEGMDQEALKLCQHVREMGAGVLVETDLMGRSLKAQFKYADKLRARFVAILGDEEFHNGVVKLKNMADSSEELIRFQDLAERVKSIK